MTLAPLVKNFLLIVERPPGDRTDTPPKVTALDAGRRDDASTNGSSEWKAEALQQRMARASVSATFFESGR